MHRIDGPGATAGNLFTEGDPTLGVPATNVTGDWLNTIQEEIANVCEEAGLFLWKPDNTQLKEAIYILAGIAAGWSTGDVKLTMKTTADFGWLMCDDGTIGNSGSAGTTRAHEDCQALFTLLWNNVNDTHAPVASGRGASAAADWDAGKTIALTKMLGRALGIAGSGASLSARALGQTIGAETHALSVAEMPSHAHGVSDPTHAHSVYDPGHLHSQTSWRQEDFDPTGGAYPIGADGGASGSAGQTIYTSSSATGISIYGAATGIGIYANGGDGAHNNMQPTAFLNVMIKL